MGPKIHHFISFIHISAPQGSDGGKLMRLVPFRDFFQDTKPRYYCCSSYILTLNGHERPAVWRCSPLSQTMQMHQNRNTHCPTDSRATLHLNSTMLPAEQGRILCGFPASLMNIINVHQDRRKKTQNSPVQQ